MVTSRRLATLATWAALSVSAACGATSTPSGPTATTPLPLVRETATMRVYYEPGDAVDVEWQESYNAWALARLGVQPPQPIEYRKYQSRGAMGSYTGHYTTNGFAEPEQWRFHTIWPRDNHEIIHVYSALVGRPSDFFNEGIAVAFQTDPVAGVLGARFNGLDVHDACRSYLRSGLLPQPLVNYVTTTPFRAVAEDIGYRTAGSFVRFLIEHHGVPAVLAFFRGGTRDESLATIRIRATQAFGRSLDDLEAEWLAFLRT